MKKRLQSDFLTRQYMLSRDFEVFYYSDLHFHSVGSHSHDYYEFYFFVEGAVQMEIGRRRFTLHSGDFILVPPGISHRAVITNKDIPYRRFVLWISKDYCTAIGEQAPDCLYLLRRAEKKQQYVQGFNALEFNTLRSRLFALLDEIHSERYGKETMVSLQLMDLLLYLSRVDYERDNPASKQEGRSHFDSITNFIDTNLEEDLSLDRLAREFFLSKYYIAHLFQRSTGLSVHQYIVKKRLTACCEAILGGSHIGETYLRYGFHDYSSFYRAFKKEYGMTPSMYLELHQQSAGEQMGRQGEQ